MSNVKQILVVRRDLNMRKGKIAAQCAHASMKVFLDRGTISNREDREEQFFMCDLTSEMQEWIQGIFTKICVSVNSEEELLEVYQKAQEANLPCSLIIDNGLTEFNGIPTKTVVAIGPAKSEDIDSITGELKLL